MEKMATISHFLSFKNMAGISCENLQMLEAFSIFLGGGGLGSPKMRL